MYNLCYFKKYIIKFFFEIIMVLKSILDQSMIYNLWHTHTHTHIYIYIIEKHLKFGWHHNILLCKFLKSSSQKKKKKFLKSHNFTPHYSNRYIERNKMS